MKRLLLLLSLVLAGCVTAPRLPDGLVRETHRVEVGGERMSVDFYFRPGQTPRPLAVVAHGFLADKQRMAHWGVMLAHTGFIAAVPTHPTLAHDARNTAALAGLVRAGRAGRWPVAAQTDGRVALVGFSRGGFETLLVAADLGEEIEAWVGLDPVDHRRRGQAVAPQVRVPGLALLAEPSALNARGNAQAMLAEYGGPLRVVSVPGSGHLDVESPRRPGFAVFENETRAFLWRVFGSD
jgi:pimeloyl-ACP methyl ester carboxylesterase